MNTLHTLWALIKTVLQMLVSLSLSIVRIKSGYYSAKSVISIYSNIRYSSSTKERSVSNSSHIGLINAMMMMIYICIMYTYSYIHLL